MFNNLFGKKEKNSHPEVTVAEKSKYPAVVHEIHNEFLTAGDKILDEAAKLLKELECKDVEKGKRLAAVGFGKTREAVIAIETENKLVITKEIANLVRYYRTEYPYNKFITEEQVKDICEKYGLVCGETDLYKGFVPENKLADIEKLKVKKEDIGVSRAWYISDPYTTCTFSEKYLAGWKKQKFDAGEPVLHEKWYYKKDIKLKICAPLKDMEIPLGKQVKDYRIQNIPDPVVLQPVKGGYLVVCAWGDEASDPVVVNEINN